MPCYAVITAESPGAHLKWGETGEEENTFKKQEKDEREKIDREKKRVLLLLRGRKRRTKEVKTNRQEDKMRGNERKKEMRSS